MGRQVGVEANIQKRYMNEHGKTIISRYEVGDSGGHNSSRQTQQKSG